MKLPSATTLILFLFFLLNLSCTDEKINTTAIVQITSHNELGEHFADVPIFITLRLGSEITENILWEFGDNTTSTELSTYHSFPKGPNRISVTAETPSRKIYADTTVNIIDGPMVYGEEDKGEFGLFVFKDDELGYGLLYSSYSGSTELEYFIEKISNEYAPIKVTQIDIDYRIGPLLQTYNGNIALPIGSTLHILNSEGEKIHEQFLGAQFNNQSYINAAGVDGDDLVYHYYSHGSLVSLRISLNDFNTVSITKDINFPGLGLRSVFDSGNSTYISYYSDALHSTAKELITYSDFDGNIIFSREFSNELFLRNVVKVADGWILSSEEVHNSTVLIKIDLQGNIKWKKEIYVNNDKDIAPNYHANKVIELEDHLYLFFDNMRCVKIDGLTGDTVWDKYFDLINSIWTNTTLTDQGTFIMIGRRLIRPDLSYPDERKKYDLVLLEITKDGIRI